MKNGLLIFGLCLTLACCVKGPKKEEMLDSFFYKQAVEIIENMGDMDEALSCLNDEIRYSPHNGYAYYQMARAYKAKGMPEEALEKINKAVKYLQEDEEWMPLVYRERADVYLELGNEKSAMKDWELAQKVSPKDVGVLKDRAEFYYQKKMYEESDADYDRICEIEPENTLGYMGKGRNARNQKKYDEALKMFSLCTSIDSSFSQAFAFRAECLFYLNRIDEAIDDIVIALNLDDNDKAYNLMMEICEIDINMLVAKLKIQKAKEPDEYKWPDYLGDVYEEKKIYAKAIESYKEAVMIEPRVEGYAMMSACYEELGDYEQAQDNIRKALELEPADEFLLMKNADLLYDMGKGKEAIEAYDEYIKTNPDYFMGYYRRGFMKDNLKDADGAIEDYSMAIALNPNYAYAYLGRGDMYRLKGKKEDSEKDYQKVIALDTIMGENNCAQYAYLGLGDEAKAKAFESDILTHSGSAGNYYDAACLYARMGDKTAALNYLRTSLEKRFVRFAHIRNDDDFDGLRHLPSFKNMISKYERIYKEELKKRAEEGQKSSKKEYASEIPFTVDSGNLFVNCLINEVPMRLVFDTGCSDVSISLVEASFMLKNGYLSNKDIKGTASYSDALGNVSEGTLINLKKVKFGDVELNNVRASIVRNQEAPLLLGQSVLSRFRKIEIDNQRKVIVVRYMK